MNWIKTCKSDFSWHPSPANERPPESGTLRQGTQVISNPVNRKSPGSAAFEHLVLPANNQPTQLILELFLLKVALMLQK